MSRKVDIDVDAGIYHPPLFCSKNGSDATSEHGSLSAKVNKNSNLGYSHDQA